MAAIGIRPVVISNPKKGTVRVEYRRLLKETQDQVATSLDADADVITVTRPKYGRTVKASRCMPASARQNGESVKAFVERILGPRPQVDNS